MIGALLFDATLMEEAFVKLTEDHFFSERHRLIWRMMRSQYATHQTYSLQSVQEGLRAQGKLGEAGDLHYLETLTLAVDDPYNWKVLAAILNDYAERRRLIMAAAEIAATASDLSIPMPDVKIKAASALYAATKDDDDMDSGNFITKLVDWHDDPRAVRGYATGMPELDEWSGGFDTEALVCLIGYSGAGKSTLLADWMYYILANFTSHRRPGKPIRVLVVPTEMTAEQWKIRLTAAALASNYKELKQGGYRDLQSLLEVANSIAALPCIYLDKAQPTGQDVLDWCAMHDPDVVIVDGVSDMGGAGGEFERVSENMQCLHTAMKPPRKGESGRLVIFSSQMNNDSKARSNKRPNARDGRGSPSRIYQLSTHMFTIYRPHHLVEIGEIDEDDFEREYGLRSMDGKYITNHDATEIAYAKDRFGGDTGKFAIRAFIRRGGQHGFFPLPEADYRRTTTMRDGAPSLAEVGGYKE